MPIMPATADARARVSGVKTVLNAAESDSDSVAPSVATGGAGAL